MTARNPNHIWHSAGPILTENHGIYAPYPGYPHASLWIAQPPNLGAPASAEPAVVADYWTKMVSAYNFVYGTQKGDEPCESWEYAVRISDYFSQRERPTCEVYDALQLAVRGLRDVAAGGGVGTAINTLKLLAWRDGR